MLRTTERRFIGMEDLRVTCIKHNWMTEATNEEYDEFLVKWSKIANLTTNKVFEMAREVFNHTDVDEAYGDDYALEEVLAAIMFDIADACTTTFAVFYQQI